MSVTIRLARAGSRKNAFFHLVATDSRNPRDGRFIERLGHYDPRQQPSKFLIKRERVEHWIKHGATTSPTVARLLAKDKKQPETES
jgi:small subunit ribosomal protein S16